MQEESEDWSKVLNENPLPNAIYFRIKRQYVQLDTLANIKKDLESQTYVSDVKYPEALVGKLNNNIRIVSIALLVIVIIISLVVIFLIDNTIRLAMFSNRFLIKTMQMVGATRGFIAKPLNIRAIIRNRELFIKRPWRGKMKSYRRELWFNIPTRRAFVNITSDVNDCLRTSDVKEGLVLVVQCI